MPSTRAPCGARRSPGGGGDDGAGTGAASLARMSVSPTMGTGVFLPPSCLGLLRPSSGRCSSEGGHSSGAGSSSCRAPSTTAVEEAPAATPKRTRRSRRRSNGSSTGSMSPTCKSAGACASQLPPAACGSQRPVLQQQQHQQQVLGSAVGGLPNAASTAKPPRPELQLAGAAGCARGLAADLERLDAAAAPWAWQDSVQAARAHSAPAAPAQPSCAGSAPSSGGWQLPPGWRVLGQEAAAAAVPPAPLAPPQQLQVLLPQQLPPPQDACATGDGLCWDAGAMQAQLLQDVSAAYALPASAPAALQLPLLPLLAEGSWQELVDGRIDAAGAAALAPCAASAAGVQLLLAASPPCDAGALLMAAAAARLAPAPQASIDAHSAPLHEPLLGASPPSPALSLLHRRPASFSGSRMPVPGALGGTGAAMAPHKAADATAALAALAALRCEQQRLQQEEDEVLQQLMGSLACSGAADAGPATSAALFLLGDCT